LNDIDDLIFRSLEGSLTLRGERTLTTWRREAPANESHYQALARVWEVTGRALPVVAGPPPGASAVIEQAESDSRVLPWPANRVVRLAVRMVAAAAAIVLAVALGRLAMRGGAAPAAKTVVYTTGTDELRTVHLADGSVVRLAPSTVLRFRNGAVREASLDGRAFFAVDEQPGHPFVVRTPVGNTRVLGTRFSLSTNARAMELVVVEGRVALSTTHDTVEVVAGQGSHVVKGEAPVVQPVPDVYSVVNWVGDVLIFQDTPLSDAVSEVERRYNVSIELASPSLGARKITAVFTHQNFSQVFTTICRVANLHCTTEGSRGIIGP
jgi:transmembrane sensor